jgi:hypothetical protein
MADTLDTTLLTGTQGDADFMALIRPALLKELGLTEEEGGYWQDKNGQKVEGSYSKPPENWRDLQWVGTGDKTLRPMTEEEKIAGMTPEEKAQYDIDKAASAKAVKAAAGELEVPQEITDRLNEQANISNSLLRQRLGKFAPLSTPGIKSASAVSENAANVKSAYAHGEEDKGLGLLGLTDQSLLNQGNLLRNNTAGLITGGTGLAGMGAASQGVPDTITSLNRGGGLAYKNFNVNNQGALLNLAGSGAGLLLMA